MSSSEPASPCIAICVLDAEDICQGCYRSAQEITDWWEATAAAKRAILQQAAARLRASASQRLK